MSQEEWDNMGKVINTPKPQPTEWQPKWGEEVGIDSCTSTQYKTGILKTSFLTSTLETRYVIEVDDDLYRITSRVKQIPPKPKTLREEVEELKESSNYAVYTVAINDVLAIIDRHEKGATNE
jgi:hypothetical protein